MTRKIDKEARKHAWILISSIVGGVSFTAGINSDITPLVVIGSLGFAVAGILTAAAVLQNRKGRDSN